MDRSTRKQLNAATEASGSRAAAGGPGKQATDVSQEIATINRLLARLEIQLVICWRQIDDNLQRRENLVQEMCLLISVLENSLAHYDQAVYARRQLEETLNDHNVLDFGDDILDFHDAVLAADENDADDIPLRDSIHELQEDVVRAKRLVGCIRDVCKIIEPQLKLRKTENETTHASLCDKLCEIERSRQAAIARLKQLYASKKSTKKEK